MKSCMCSENVK